MATENEFQHVAQFGRSRQAWEKKSFLSGAILIGGLGAAFVIGMNSALGFVVIGIAVALTVAIELVASTQFKCPGCGRSVSAGGDASEEFLSRCPGCLVRWQ